MSILVNRKSRVLVQGITGGEGTFHTSQMIAYGTNIVVDIVGPREIRVSHANFGSDPMSRHIIYDSMPASDVSAANDWSAVRFWNYQLKAWGIVYPAYGFVYPDRVDTMTAQGTQ